MMTIKNQPQKISDTHEENNRHATRKKIRDQIEKDNWRNKKIQLQLDKIEVHAISVGETQMHHGIQHVHLSECCSF